MPIKNQAVTLMEATSYLLVFNLDTLWNIFQWNSEQIKTDIQTDSGSPSWFKASTKVVCI